MAKEKIKILLDTHIYDKIIDGEIPLEKIKASLKRIDYHITTVQIHELNCCLDATRRKKLLLAVNSLKPILLEPTKKSRGKIFESLQKGNDKHTQDALIGEDTIRKGIILVTEDRKLKNWVDKNGGKAIGVEEFKKIIEQ